MSGIFISYRREDSSAYAGRLYDALLAHFDREQIFIDIDSINPGEVFPEVIKQTCMTCDVLLAIMGRNWASIQDNHGKPRLASEADYVRLEIAYALERNLLVIPVLVGAAEMPDSSLLPDDIQSLVSRHAWEVSDKRFHQDVKGLVKAIKKRLAEPLPQPPFSLPGREENLAADARVIVESIQAPDPKLELAKASPTATASLRPKMRRWGAIVTLFYLLTLLFFVIPVLFGILGELNLPNLVKTYLESLSNWFAWGQLGVCVGGQILLLWLSVDTTRKRLKPRTHILVSATLTASLIAVLTFWATMALIVNFNEGVPSEPSAAAVLAVCFGSWLLWGLLFYRLSKKADDAASRAVSWLLKGSVLELLVAVPSHIMVRQRDDCSAPIITGYGIATGLAVMLMAFGPSVLFLYKDRMEKRVPSSQK